MTTAMAPGTTASSKDLAPGIYCPTVTFFKPTKAQELDLELFDKHMEFLAKAGLNGVVVQGSTAEAVALDREERKEVSHGTKGCRMYPDLLLL